MSSHEQSFRDGVEAAANRVLYIRERIKHTSHADGLGMGDLKRERLCNEIVDEIRALNPPPADAKPDAVPTPLQESERDAFDYLGRLIEAFDAEPLPTLMGRCTQVDNMLAGDAKPQPATEWGKNPAPDAVCATCGRRGDNHNVRHPFVALVKPRAKPQPAQDAPTVDEVFTGMVHAGIIDTDISTEQEHLARQFMEALAAQPAQDAVRLYVESENAPEIIDNAIRVLGEAGSGPGYTATCELEDLAGGLREALATQPAQDDLRACANVLDDAAESLRKLMNGGGSQVRAVEFWAKRLRSIATQPAQSQGAVEKARKSLGDASAAVDQMHDEAVSLRDLQATIRLNAERRPSMTLREVIEDPIVRRWLGFSGPSSVAPAEREAGGSA